MLWPTRSRWFASRPTRKRDRVRRLAPAALRQVRLLPGERPPVQLALPQVPLARPGAAVVEVVRRGAALRVIPVADPQRFVQFPRALRQLGARYMVEALHLVEEHGRAYYRAAGEIIPVPEVA